MLNFSSLNIFNRESGIVNCDMGQRMPEPRVRGPGRASVLLYPHTLAANLLNISGTLDEFLVSGPAALLIIVLGNKG